MRRGRFVYTILTVVLFLGVIVYMSIYIYDAVSSPLGTVEALLYTVEDTCGTTGYFVRDEMLLSPPERTGVREMLAEDGERVSAGQDLIAVYSNPETRENRRKLELLDIRIEQLSQAVSGELLGLSKLDSSLYEELYKKSYAVGTGNISDVYDYSDKLKTYILSRDFAYDSAGKAEAALSLERLESEAAALEATLSDGTVALKAPRTGYFSSGFDGYEAVLSRADTDNMDVAFFESIPALKQTVSEEQYGGKLVTSYEWRYVTVISTEIAETLKLNSRMTLTFDDEYIGDVRVTVSRIGDDEGGRSVVVFSCTTQLRELINYRRQNAEILLSTYEGIRVPKEAIRRSEDGRVGVYCLVAMQAKFVEVEQVYETESHYIVKYDPTDLSSLRPGDEIIVSSKNLYDGKIVK